MPLPEGVKAVSTTPTWGPKGASLFDMMASEIAAVVPAVMARYLR